MNAIVQKLNAEQATLTEWRRYLHQRPELAFEEKETAAFVAEKLKSWGYDVVEGIGGTGVVGTLKNGAGTKSIGLRADMDALPIQEMGDIPHKSQVPGKSHMCGHDAHTTMLLAAARYLSQTRNFNGTVRVFFQPAEEIMGGAVAMIKDGLFERFPVDQVLGMHNMPGLELGTLHFRTGPLMAAVDNWEIELTGKGSHGSMPEKAIDPVVAGASLVMALQTIVSRNVAAQDSAVVTIGAFQSGDAGNVIPQKAILRLSIRSSRPETRTLVLDKIRSITKAQAEAFGVAFEIREGQPGAVLVNDPAVTERVLGVAQKMFGADKVIPEGVAYMGSEDFAFMAQKRPASYVFIGNGDTAMVHHPMYDFDDRNLPIGAAFWVGATEDYLK